MQQLPHLDITDRIIQLVLYIRKRMTYTYM